MPIILLAFIPSLYRIAPTKIRATATKTLWTIDAVLTAHPALYAYITPTSRPTTEIHNNAG